MTEIILTSSVLILVLVLLRRTLRGRIDPRVQYALWLLVAARLLIPGTLFTAPVSVLGAAEGLQTALHGTFPDPEDLPEPIVSGAMDQLPSAQPAIPAGIEHPDKDTVVTAYNTIAAPEITQRVYNWPDIIWKTGIAVVGGAILLSNLAFYLRLRRNRKLLSLPAAPWSGELPVYEAAGLPSPCLFGLLRPAIYLNEAAMDAEHPEHILAHEYAHCRHGDHLWAILRSICLAIHWYNPLVWWAAALSRRDCELACDAAALKRLGEEERIGYGQTLLGMVSKGRNPAALLHTATTMTAGKRAMTERIALIIRRPRTRKITLALVAVLACLLAACAFGGGTADDSAGDEPPVQSPAEAEPSPLLEFPGLHWNDSLETVMEALGVTEADFISSGEDTAGYRNAFYFAIGDVSLYGHTAQYVTFRFIQYLGTGHELGLYSAQVSYPDDMDMEDFDAVREELVRQYGPETESSDVIQNVSSTFLGDRYDRWMELRQQEGIKTMSWNAGTDSLPEAYMGPLEAATETWQQMHPESTLEEYVKAVPIEGLYWQSCTVFAPTFFTVTFDGGGYVYCLQSASVGDAARSAGIIVNSVRIGEDPGRWLAHMNCIDWADIRRAAEDAGRDAAETEQQIIDAIYQYIRQQDTALTQREYMSVLTATAGLTGTPKEGRYQNRSDIPLSQMPLRYGDLVCALYTTNSAMFAQVVLEQLPEEQQGEILDFFRYEYEMPYYRGEYPNWKNAPSRAEALHELEAVLMQSRGQEMKEIIFRSPGESAQYRFPDFRTGGTGTFTSEDPGIVTVDDIGLMIAVSPGETNINIHSVDENGSVIDDLVCHVRCDWTDDPAANAETIRACIQREASAGAWTLLLKDASWDELALNGAQDGRDWLLDGLTDLWEYVQTAFPSREEYRAILSCTGGLDGAYSELYASILYRMYVWSPVQFADVALRDLSAAQRDAAAGLLLHEWGYYHRLDDTLSYPERLAILQERLKEDQMVLHLLSPDAVILFAPGETDTLRLTTTVTISGSSAESSDPQVVKVEPDGAGDFRITAVGPGEAEITVRCTFAGLERAYTCSVYCYW